MAWTNADIALERIDLPLARADEHLMSLVASASLVEAASDLYTANLVQYFEGDTEVTTWLSQSWEPEELQHGRALRAYVERVWPDFDWARTFEDFFGAYSALCLVEELRPTRALEMAARCVVETGTATLYRAIHQRAKEPVLRDIADRIRHDEVRHFKYFYRFFRKYQRTERLGRARVAMALINRLAEVRTEDASCALHSVYRERHRDRLPGHQDEGAWTRAIYTATKRQYPVLMATKMLLTPLNLPGPVKPLLGYPMAAAARLVMWGL